jgi:hypothetical protein
MPLGTLLQNVLSGHDTVFSDHPADQAVPPDHPAIPPVTNLIPTISAAVPSRTATSFLSDHETNTNPFRLTTQPITHLNSNANHASIHDNQVPIRTVLQRQLRPGPANHHRIIRTSFAENNLDSIKESINSGIAAARGAIEEKLKATIQEAET